MLLANDIGNIFPGSHKKFLVECDFKASHKCRYRYLMEYRRYLENIQTNDGKSICLFCSRSIKYAGRSNPNTKYNFDDYIFSVIDCEIKAYILGFIASDGHVSDRGFTIKIHKKDIDILICIRNFICKSIPIVSKPNNMVSLTVNSKQIANDISKFIPKGKKSDKVNFPNFDKRYQRHFLRGYFDGDGWVRNPFSKNGRYPSCGLSSNSKEIINSIYNFVDIPGYKSNDSISWSGNNALDFLGFIYNDCSIVMDRKYSLYCKYASWVPSFGGPGQSGDGVNFHWNKAFSGAIAPFKSRVSDSGYDLTLIKKDKTIGNVVLYDTGIKIVPDYGWFFYLIGRSSIIKSGYILANSIGVIDRSYIGTIKVPLIKIDSSAPDLDLPNRLVQIVPAPILHMEPIEVNEIEITSRNDGGFGSTGKS